MAATAPQDVIFYQKQMEYTNTKAVLEQFADELIEAYRQGLVAYNAITSGHHFLYDNIEKDVVMDKGSFTVSLRLAEYWKYVEDGRKAYGENWKGHRPPISAISDWIDWKPYTGTQRGVGYAAVTPSLPDTGVRTDNRGLAYAVATKIAKEGIPAKPIMRESVNKTLIAFGERIKAAIALDVNAEVVNLIGQLFDGVTLKKIGGQWKGENTYRRIEL